MQMNKKRTSGIVRLLSAVLALVLCCGLAAPVYADEVEELNAQTMAAAWEELVAQFTPEQQEFYGTAVVALNTETYVQEDLYKAVKTAAACIVSEENVQKKLEAIKEAIAANPGLTDAQKTGLTEALDAGMPDSAFDAVETLMTSAQNLITDAAYVVSTGELDDHQAKLAEVEAMVSSVEALLEQTGKLPDLDAQLDKFQTVRNEAALLDVNEFTIRREEIEKSVDEFFTLAPADQVLLADSIAQLAADVAAYPDQILMDTVTRADALEKQVDTLSEELEAARGQALLGIIALALAGVGILLTIVVAVFAIGKSRGEQVDLSVMASREDVKAVTRQNEILKGQLEQAGLRTEHIARELEAMRARSVAAPVPPVVEEKEEPKQEEPKQEAPVVVMEPEKPVLGSTNVACNLRMNYQFINPATSYLTEDPSGKVVLFSDNTVEPAESEKKMINELQSWISNGLFVLFEVEVGGKVQNAASDKLPGGYFRIGEIVRRPVVALSGKSYLVISKGYIRMK